MRHLGPWWGRGALALLGALLMLGAAPIAEQAGPVGPAVSPLGPEACLNLPVSGALIAPASCWVTGPTSVLIVGADPRAVMDGAAVIVDGQHARKLTLPGSGAMRIHRVASRHACISDFTGTFDLDLAGARAVPVGNSTCPGAAPARGSGFAAASQEIIATTQATGGMPSPASSYYVFGAFLASCGPTATSGCPLYVDGADEPSPSGGPLVVLDFGAPCFVPPTTGAPIYGTQLFNTTTCTTDDQLLPLAQAFARGYQSTHGAGSPLAIIALGTSNSLNGVNTGHALTGPQMHDSGQAWFTNLVQPFAASLAGPALIVPWAANDIEGSSSGNFYDPTLTTPWVDGYGSAAATSLGGTKFCAGNDPYRMADYGDDVLTNGWTDSLYYQVAWGAPVACAVPEIYVTANATQWQRTSQWGVSNGKGPITFTGPMSLGGEAGTLSWQDSWNA
ncbi:MAG: hypothetical protein E6I86_16060, partial [Chloroflexi bacterium]